jgi:hypothetical protein
VNLRNEQNRARFLAEAISLIAEIHADRRAKFKGKESLKVICGGGSRLSYTAALRRSKFEVHEGGRA